jgi:hypothetical protein
MATNAPAKKAAPKKAAAKSAPPRSRRNEEKGSAANSSADAPASFTVGEKEALLKAVQNMPQQGPGFIRFVIPDELRDRFEKEMAVKQDALRRGPGPAPTPGQQIPAMNAVAPAPEKPQQALITRLSQTADIMADALRNNVSAARRIFGAHVDTGDANNTLDEFEKAKGQPIESDDSTSIISKLSDMLRSLTMSSLQLSEKMLAVS